MKEVLSDTLPSSDINLTLFPLATANDHIYTNAPLSRPISEVKRVRARLVRTWGTSLESRGVVGKFYFFFFLFFCHFYPEKNGIKNLLSSMSSMSSITPPSSSTPFAFASFPASLPSHIPLVSNWNRNSPEARQTKTLQVSLLIIIHRHSLSSSHHQANMSVNTRHEVSLAKLE